MPIEFTDVITFSAGGAVGFFAKTFISHKLATDRNFKAIAISEFNAAADKFRTCFTEEIRVLQKDGGTNPHEFLSKTHTRHWDAVIEFSPVLSAKGKKSLDEQWEKYQQAYQDGSLSSIGKSASERKVCYALALQLILELTDVSKYK